MIRKLLRGYDEIFFPTDNLLDMEVAREILVGRAYPKVAGEAAVIWDVGANIGAAAMYFAKTYPNALIHCFEPSTDMVWECLQENTSNVRKRCQLYQYGLASRTEERSMNEWPLSTVTRSCKHQPNLAEELPACQFRTPEDVSEVTIMKIDTEGCEVEILEAMDGRHRVPVFYLEYHSEADRRKIDALLPNHALVRAESKRKHRGNLCYLHQSIETVEDKFEIT
jgi:FkbM family methyltransferase